ncbi:MAG: chemotaxis protein, partial [Rhodoferax sp.]
GQINSAVSQLSQTTQQNASSSEELAATAEEMSSQAEQLQQTMAFFKLDGASGIGASAITARKAAGAAKPKPAKTAPVKHSRSNFAQASSGDVDESSFSRF